MNKILKCDDLLWLQDAPLFREEVAFKIKLGEYTVKESYQEFKEVKDGFRTVTDSKCYLNNITDYTYSVRDEDKVLNSYKGDGPAIFEYVKPYTNSTAHIVNREAKSIGYKTSTGDIQNCTKLMSHIIFEKSAVSSNYKRITNEFFKGNDKDGENPVLNRLLELNFYGYEDEDNFMKALETRTLFDRDGNIEDYLISDNLYCQTEMGELICVNSKFKYSSTGDNDRNVIPRLIRSDKDNTLFTVEYYQKANRAVVLSSEIYKLNREEGTVRLVETTVGFGDHKRVTTFLYDKLDEDGNIAYISTIDTDGKSCCIKGYTNSPVSADYFVYDKYKDDITVGMNSYFSNIFRAEYLGAAMLTYSYITEAVIAEGSTIKSKYTYQRNNHGQYISQMYACDYKEGITELSKIKTSKLPNGHDLVESVILAEPMYPKHTKSIFYQANEVNDKDELISSYTALVVDHKEH